jgi:hypothetical protein
MPLNLKPNLKQADSFYEMLLKAHDTLTPEESMAFNACLILVLSNHIGDEEILSEALKIAAKPKKL